jgi:hypothetical protein
MTAHDHRTLIPGCYRCELDKEGCVPIGGDA